MLPKHPLMDRDYDLFEVCPGEEPIWRSSVSSARLALSALEEMGHRTTHECFTLYLKTNEVLWRVNQAHLEK